jgi:hypothetical protein
MTLSSDSDAAREAQIPRSSEPEEASARAARSDGGASGVEEVMPQKRTLPPPEWSAPRSVSGITLEWLTRHAPVARRRGARAELAALRGKLRTATRHADTDAERTSAMALARALAERGTELDLATKLARRSLMLGDDPALREELSSWFAALGEPGLAAATLRPLVETESGERLGRLLTRIAVFLGRHGDARGAAEALASAAAADTRDAVAEELRGAIGAWAPDAVPAPEAATAYLEAARRRDADGEGATGFEDLLRAFEIGPAHTPAAEALARALAARGRSGAADEVLREHARALGDRGLAIHRARLRDAIVDGDTPRALAAAFDAGLDRSFDPHALASAATAEDSAAEIVSFDRLLADGGLHAVVAARLELAAETLSGADRARLRVAEGRLSAGPIGSGERAVEAWIDAVVSDPGSDVAKALLRQHAAASGDHGPLVEALVRVGLGTAEAHAPERAACLRELVVLADQRLSDPSLALWSVRRLLAVDERDEELRALGSRLAHRARLQDEALASTRVQLESARGAARVEQLRMAAVALRGRPDEAEDYVRVLEELARVLPEERVWRFLYERLLVRLGRTEALEELYRRDLERKLPKAQHERARLGLSAIARARGDQDGAVAVLEPLLTAGALHRAGWAMLFVLATRAGREAMRAEALRLLATLLEPPLGALLASVASDVFLAAGDEAGARRAAEQACHADTSAPRSIAALARATASVRDRVAAVALERAAGVVLPRASSCRALAEIFDALGEPENALAWTQRWLALRPGDRVAAAALLGRVTAAGDPAKIADALGWLLAQPEPLLELVPHLASSIRRLADIEPTRGATLARRALDVFGPRILELNEAVIKVADQVGERTLGIAVIERMLASGAQDGDRAPMLLGLARRRREAGDPDGAARALVRALSEGADPGAVLAQLDAALPPRTSDGELALLEARAEALSALSSADLEGTARLWRDYGAALWDLADDREGAIAAWERAAALDTEDGVERLARDLVAFAGHAEAVRRLEDLATRKRNRSDVARALAAASGVALEGGFEADALQIALRALEADSSRADVLAIAERSASDKDVEHLERAYDIIARGALGVYGERATHYRAARQLERRGFRDRALRHAITAFEAVPAEGVTFVLMMRLSERTKDATEAVAAIERVAAQQKLSADRAQWLRRAALVAGAGEDGKRQRVDVLLRALEANPHAETLRSLGVAFADLVRAIPDEKDIAELRFSRALKAMLPRLEGPDGARVAVEAAGTALGTFESAALAIGALDAAAAADASIDEYGNLVASARALAADPAVATAFVAKVEGLVRSPHANVGGELVRLAEAVASAAKDVHGRARLLAAAALREPDDARLLERAESAARASGDAALLESVLAAVPVPERVARLADRSAKAEARGDLTDAILALEEARAIERIPDAARREAGERLRSLYRAAHRLDALEALLRDDLERAEPEARATRGRELAVLLSELGRAEDALSVLELVLPLAPKDRELLTEYWNQARQADDARRQIDSLSRLVDIEADPPKKLVLLQRLAALLSAEGEEGAALARYKEILALDERDATAAGALERDAERRGDWEALVELLARRARLSAGVDEARQVRLHRAELLETRLGRPEDARSELESLLAATGDHREVLTRLADLNERLGAKLRAAPLWLRAGAMPKDRGEAGELARRACQAYLDGGDVESARRVFGEMSDYPRTPRLVALRVDIERRGENPRALSEALEEMALSSMDPPRVRAGLLVEAARAALAAGQLSMALGQAQRAARIARESAEPQLFARLLEYRKRGAGSREEASTTITELRAVREPLEPPARELSAFLLAEALDVAHGEGEGLRELSRVHAELGPLPLVALGMAERLARGAEPERALSLFDTALEGDLRELRRRGHVAIAAAKAALAAKQPDRALDYLEIAASMPETRAVALGMQTEIRASLGRLSDAPPLPEPLLSPEAPRVVEPAPPPPASVRPLEGLRASAPPKPVSRRPSAPDLPAALLGEPAPPVSIPAVAASVRPVSTASSAPTVSTRAPAEAATPPVGTAVQVAVPSPPDAGSGSHAAVATTGGRGGRLPFAPKSGNEETLLAALSRGSIDAGKELVRDLEPRPERSHDLVSVCRVLAHLIPGDHWVLEKLYQATLADRDLVYARAVEHVLRAFDPKASPLEPPPLSEQIEQPDRVHAVLFRDTACPATEALGLVWSGAQHMFRRDPSSYGVTGLERVAPNAPTPLARLFGAVGRLFGMTRTPLFQRKSGEPITINVALLSPPALLLTGEVKHETPALAYHLGAMLAATLPEHVLLYGASEAQVENVLRALVAAFGPPKAGRGDLASIATLAEMLWESVPARSQRRLRELCDDPSRIRYGEALGAARQAVRRAGLFASGDLTVAIRETCADLGFTTFGLDSPGGLEALSRSSPAVADLVRLATSQEYASTRWQHVRAGGRHSSGTWSTV